MAEWNDSAREDFYRAMAEAVTAAGREGESLLLSKLCLLMAEELKAPEKAMAALNAALVAKS